MIPSVEQVLNAIEKHTQASPDTIRLEIKRQIGLDEIIESLSCTLLSMLNDKLIWGYDYRYLLTEKGEDLFTTNYIAANPEYYPQTIQQGET